jgi:hypothetical protein
MWIDGDYYYRCYLQLLFAHFMRVLSPFFSSKYQLTTQLIVIN